MSRARAFANNSPHVRGPYTPHTPAINNGDGNVKSGLSTTTPANPMMPIFENGHPGSTGHPQHPQTPSHQVFHHPYYYGSPYGPAYGAFAPPAFGDMGQMTAPVFPQMGNSPSGLGHGQYGYPGYYPQGYNGPQYYYHHPQSTPGEIPNNDSGPVNNTPATGTPAQGTTSPPPVNNESTS